MILNTFDHTTEPATDNSHEPATDNTVTPGDPSGRGDTGGGGGRWVSPTGPYLHAIGAIMYLLGCAVTFIDVVLGKSVFNIIVNASETISWAIAAGISVTAILLTTSAGIELRNGGRKNQVTAALLIAAWVALGLTLAYLRYSEGSIRGRENNPKDAAIAAMMLAMYFAAGLDILVCSHTLWNPRHAALVSSKIDLALTDPHLRRITAKRHRVANTLATFPHRLARLDSSYLAASGIIDQQEAELKGIARDDLVRALADPTRSTQVYRSSHQPTTDHLTPKPDPTNSPNTTT